MYPSPIYQIFFWPKTADSIFLHPNVLSKNASNSLLDEQLLSDLVTRFRNIPMGKCQQVVSVPFYFQFVLQLYYMVFLLISFSVFYIVQLLEHDYKKKLFVGCFGTTQKPVSHDDRAE